MLDRRLKDFLYFLAYFYLQHRKAEKARILLEALSAAGVDDWHVNMALAQAEVIEGNHAEALEHARRAHRLCSSRRQERQTLFQMARSLWGLGHKDEARLYFKKFMETDA